MTLKNFDALTRVQNPYEDLFLLSKLIGFQIRFSCQVKVRGCDKIGSAHKEILSDKSVEGIRINAVS